MAYSVRYIRKNENNFSAVRKGDSERNSRLLEATRHEATIGFTTRTTVIARHPRSKWLCFPDIPQHDPSSGSNIHHRLDIQ